MSRNPSSDNGGFSLLESVVVTALFFLAMAMITTLFVYGSRFTRSGGQRTELQTTRIRACNQIRQSMANSRQSGNTVFYFTPGPAQDDLVISLISPVDASGNRGWNAADQRPVFSGYEVYYRQASSDTLRVVHVPRVDSEAAEPLSESDIRTALAAHPSRELANGITSFQLVSPQDNSVLDSWVNPLGLRITQQTERGTPILSEFSYKFPAL